MPSFPRGPVPSLWLQLPVKSDLLPKVLIVAEDANGEYHTVDEWEFRAQLEDWELEGAGRFVMRVLLLAIRRNLSMP